MASTESALPPKNGNCLLCIIASKEKFCKSGCIRTTVHLLVFTAHLSAVVYRIAVVDDGHDGFGGQFRFLSDWNMVTQTCYFGVCLLTDLVNGEKPMGKERGKLQHLRDFLHYVQFAQSMFVVSTYWIVFAFNPGLIERKESRPPGWVRNPKWLKSGFMHTGVLFFMLLDKCVSFHLYPKTRNVVAAMTSYILTYGIWVLIQAWYADYWVYPFLKKFSIPFILLYYAAVIAFTVLFYFIGKAITRLIWRKEFSRTRIQTQPSQYPAETISFRLESTNVVSQSEDEVESLQSWTTQLTKVTQDTQSSFQPSVRSHQTMDTQLSQGSEIKSQ